MAKHKKKEKTDTVGKLAILTAEGFRRVDERFEHMDKRFDGIEARLTRIESELFDIKRELADIRKRIEFLEVRGASNAGFAKEIDRLLEHVEQMDKRLKKVEATKR